MANKKLITLEIKILCIFQALNNCLLLPSTGDNLIEESIGQMIREIVRKYYNASYCVGIVSENGHPVAYILGEIPTVLIVNSKIPEMDYSEEYGNLRDETAIFDKIMVQMLDLSCSDFIIQVSDAQNVVQYFSRSSRRSQNRFHRRYLYLPLIQENRFQNPDASIIFNMKEMIYMPDLITAHVLEKDNVLKKCNRDNKRSLYQNNESYTEIQHLCLETIEIELKTHKYIGHDNAAEIKLDKWSPYIGFQSGVSLYPNKIKNLQGKQLNITTIVEYPPYVVTDLTASPSLYEGIEFRIAKDYETFINCTFEVVIEIEGEWGELWPNGTGTGMWGKLTMDFAVLGFGALYAWLEPYPYVDYTLPYTGSYVLCMTPHPKLLPGWMTPFLPFTIEAWVAVAASQFITGISLYLTSKAQFLIHDSRNKIVKTFLKTTDCIFWSIGLLLLQAPICFKNPPLRQLLTWLMLFYILVSTIYISGLASLLTTPRFENPINTVADLAKSGLKWVANADAWVYTILEATEPDMVTIVNNFRVLKENELLQHAYDGDRAFALERLMDGTYALPSYLNNETLPHLRVMREDIYSGTPLFNVRKGSPFLESFNTLLLRLHASGITHYYELKVVQDFGEPKLQLMVDKDEDVSTPVKLQISHIEGPIFFLLFGLLGAFLIFIGEILKPPKKILKRREEKQM
ncbi:Ionotropic receptor 41a4 [Blattella germanica]|nr:Ionotropic receptor 41a4 [Blattella germanica]